MVDDGTKLGANIIFSPFCGGMNEISCSALPFPHRVGTLLDIQYVLMWYRQVRNDASYHIEYIRELNKYMTSFVSLNPKVSYVNYQNFDLGSVPFN